jgi:hypothetical protein
LLTNLGTVTISNATGQIVNTGRVNSSGTINIQVGTVNNSGVINIKAGAFNSSGVVNNVVDALITNSGTINNLTSYPSLRGVINNAGTINNAVSGSAAGTINNLYLINNFIQNSSGVVSGGTITGGTLNNGSATTNNDGSVSLVNPTGSQIKNCAIVNSLGAFIYNTPGQGFLSGSGGTIDDGQHAGAPGPAITNNGKIFNGGSIVVSDLVNGGTANITNATYGTISLASSGTSTKSNLTNNGWIQNEYGSTITIPGANGGTITNNGTIQNDGTIHGSTPAQVTGTPAPYGAISPNPPQFP